MSSKHRGFKCGIKAVIIAELDGQLRGDGVSHSNRLTAVEKKGDTNADNGNDRIHSGTPFRSAFMRF